MTVIPLERVVSFFPRKPSTLCCLLVGVLYALQSLPQTSSGQDFAALSPVQEDKASVNIEQSMSDFSSAFQNAYENRPKAKQPTLKSAQTNADIKLTHNTAPTTSAPTVSPATRIAKRQEPVRTIGSYYNVAAAAGYQDTPSNQITIYNLPTRPTKGEMFGQPIQQTAPTRYPIQQQQQSFVAPAPRPQAATTVNQWVDGQVAQTESVPAISVAWSAPKTPAMPTEFQEPKFDARSTPQQMIWWRNQVVNPIYKPQSNLSVDANTLVYDALKRSPRIRAISQDPLIREMQIVEADADFDVVNFVRSQFQDRVDPVGDNLSITVDGSDFIQDHIWTADLGLRKKARTGATYELGQQIGFRNSNSNFFNPQDQGTATLSLNVTQPLLRGRGRYYNESQILIAQVAERVAWNTFVSELQDELQNTVAAYWQLYYARSIYLQRQKNVDRGQVILEKLEGRKELDSLPSQIARARSAVQSRKTDLANALRDIRDAETEIRRLTADKNWKANQSIEMIPLEAPINQDLGLELEQIVTTALKHRPEIQETMKRAKIAAIQRDVSVNELLPELSFLMGTYISALRGESQVLEAIGDQFSGIKPGYSVGFEFELPYGNRAARSRLAQRKLQLAKITSEVDEVIQNVTAESQVSLRRVTSARETLDAALQAIDAARYDLEQNQQRWDAFALVDGDLSDGQNPTTILDQLLDSQERLVSTELVFSQAELDLKTAEVALQRTMGTLLIHQEVSFGKGMVDDTPTLSIEKFSQQAPGNLPMDQSIMQNQPMNSFEGELAPVPPAIDGPAK